MCANNSFFEYYGEGMKYYNPKESGLKYGMAAKQSSNNDRSENSKTLLPCIAEDQLLTATKSSRESILKTAKHQGRAYSYPNAATTEEIKITSGKHKEGDEEGRRPDQHRVQINNRKLNKRTSLSVGFYKGKSGSNDPKESGKDAPKMRRGSKENIEVVKPPSPDIIDLSNEKVVQELLLRLYQTLKTPDETARESPDKEHSYWKIEKPTENLEGFVEQKEMNRKMKECSKNEANFSKSDSRLKTYHRHSVNTFPQLNKSTPTLQVFYSKPVSWESLKMRSLQRRKRTTNSFAIQDSSRKCSLPGRKEAINRQVGHLTWPYTEYSRLESSRAVLCDRGLSVPLLMRHSNAFVSPKLLKTTSKPRKSVTFAI